MKPNWTTIKNVWFYAIVLLGVYLSVAAIAALPELREAPAIPEEVSVERLRETLERSLDASQQRFGASIAAPAEADAPADAPAEPDAPGVRARLSLLNGLRRDRALLADRWVARREADLAEKRRAIENAVVAYETEAMRPGTRERRDHFLRLVQWYGKGSSALDAQLEVLREMVKSVDRQVEMLARGEMDADMKELGEARKQRLTGVRNVIESRPWFAEPPMRSELGGGKWLGPFTFVASWLMKTESLELALITGLLGFGLLGAATSSFVREHTVAAQDGPLVSNLTRLILSGTAAAFAVFLAVKGGLAVFASTDADPNPYVLLLTCFVAAVYREDAWARVRKLVGQEAIAHPPADADADARARAEAEAPPPHREGGEQGQRGAPDRDAGEEAHDEGRREVDEEARRDGGDGIPALAIHRGPAEERDANPRN